jgi:hypothetical protein
MSRIFKNSPVLISSVNEMFAVVPERFLKMLDIMGSIHGCVASESSNELKNVTRLKSSTCISTILNQQFRNNPKFTPKACTYFYSKFCSSWPISPCLSPCFTLEITWRNSKNFRWIPNSCIIRRVLVNWSVCSFVTYDENKMQYVW